jgi:CheY-like chemotaxis protein
LRSATQADDSNEARATMLNEQSQPLRGTRDRPLILLVDDDAAERELYGGVLCYNGFDVVFAKDGATALRAAMTWKPDLVVLDIGLPDMSGVTVCRQLRRTLGKVDLPVIVLSGFPKDALGTAARAAGCALYLEKPTSPVEVMHAIEDMVGRPPLPGVGTPPRILTGS